MAGYSGTPLIKKLGIKEGQQIAFLHEPQSYRRTLGKLPAGIVPVDKLTANVTYDLIHIFVTEASTLQREFSQARKHLVTNGAIWVSWPKKSSGVKTELNENIVRETGLDLGLVDVKVCAVDETWSGLKFVYRLKDR